MTIPAVALEAGVASTRPTYVYDLQKLRQRCIALEEIPIERKSIFYATMANDHPTILACIRDQGHGVFVNSPRHLRLALELGFEPSRIVYAASNMLAEEMQVCLDCEVRLILDSISQIQFFAEIAGRGHEIGIRLNVGNAIDGIKFREDVSYRFGLLPVEIPLAVDIAKKHGVRITGAHSYFGTDLIVPDLLLEGLEHLGRVAEAFPDLRYLDIGGGFGVPDSLHGEEFDLELYGHEAEKIMKHHEVRSGRKLELVLEPGRYLTANCGYFFVKVIDLKVRPDRVFVGTNGSVAIFPRPLMYPDRAVHPCEIIGPRNFNPPHKHPIYICGNSTYSRDFLARELHFPLPELRDTIVFHNAGAYCRSMITEFLGKDRPEEVVLESVMWASGPPVSGVSR